MTRHALHWIAPAALTCTLLAGCAVPSINLATNEPIKVDITMRVDVYQFEGSDDDARVVDGGANGNAAGGATREERRANRLADIQTFKNSRIVGEGRQGLLIIRDEIEGDYGDYVRRVVERENADRMAEMRELAEQEKRPLADIQAEQAQLWINRSFQGEWIERQQDDSTWRWVQKEG